MNIDALAYWSEVSALAVQFPGAEEGSSYGTPAFKVDTKLFARLKEDGEEREHEDRERDGDEQFDESEGGTRGVRG